MANLWSRAQLIEHFCVALDITLGFLKSRRRSSPTIPENKMPVYMNNLHGRDHETIYGHQAFFDLNQFGQQAAMAPNIQPREECLVASYGDKLAGNDRRVVFKKYVFIREDSCPSEDIGVSCRVFFGELKGTITMPKSEAVKNPLYAPFFNKVGHFKQRSVV